MVWRSERKEISCKRPRQTKRNRTERGNGRQSRLNDIQSQTEGQTNVKEIDGVKEKDGPKEKDELKEKDGLKD